MSWVFVPGWVDTPERHAVAATLPTFAAVGPRSARGVGESTNVLLYRAYADATGAYWPYERQQIGDCVSHGHGHGNDLLQCVEWVMQGGQRGGFKRADAETDTEALYGMAREAGNMLGDQDGCYGSAAVKAMTTMGVVPRSAVGPYSGQRAKEWGRSGAPREVKEQASRFKLGSAALVKTWDELLRALGNGYPVTICTGLGFTMHRDEQGFCSRQGQWGHCMCCVGIRQDSRPGACIFQSWGPNVPDGPTTLDQPDNTFWIGRADIEAILSEGDSWALSNTPFFVERPVPSHWKYGDLSGF